MSPHWSPTDGLCTMMMRLLLTIPLLCLLLATSAWAGLDEGMAAYKHGDYAAALREFRPIAEQGSATAQYKLGVMYSTGQGVVQDYVLAHVWFNIAAKRMTPADISKAQRMAREWVAKFEARQKKTTKK
jgi:TPR repeat protein